MHLLGLSEKVMAGAAEGMLMQRPEIVEFMSSERHIHDRWLSRGAGITLGKSGAAGQLPSYRHAGFRRYQISFPILHPRESKMKRTLILAAIATAVAGQVQARDYISIVGSSTVYPFATVVAERFGKTTDFKTPKIESTGSGGGLKLFCAGVGVEHPDVTNASRRIKESEVEKCAGNGVTDVVEVKIGYDGIVFANSRKSEPVEISRKQIFLALAKDVPDPNGGETLVPNPYMKWSDVDASLPDSKIEVLGPPPTSGTRDAVAELALEGGCKKIDWIEAMKKSDKNKYKTVCHTVREDGGYVEAESCPMRHEPER